MATIQDVREYFEEYRAPSSRFALDTHMIESRIEKYENQGIDRDSFRWCQREEYSGQQYRATMNRNDWKRGMKKKNEKYVWKGHEEDGHLEKISKGNEQRTHFHRDIEHAVSLNEGGLHVGRLQPR
jgi:hypothetical protein